VQWVAVAIVLVDTFIWYGSVALFFSAEQVQRWYRRASRTMDRIAAGVMIAFGARLVVGRI